MYMKRSVDTLQNKEESEEEDFMSDAFLLPSEKDVRPGIHKTHQAKREHQMHEKKLRCDPKPLWLLEKETRIKGLSTPLDNSNKGFRILEKMGFKQGNSTALSANPEPLPLVIKEDRTCLGRNKPTIDIMKSEDLTNAYKNRQREKFRQNILQRDIGTSQKVCLQLDLEQDIKEPLKKWFWPPIATQAETTQETDENREEEEEEEQCTDEEILSELTSYLRSKYYHCVWCGVKYNSSEDLESSCPGAKREDHD